MLQEKPSLPQKSCAKLKLALKSKVRCSAELYSNGEIVYFKRDNDSSWQGTGGFFRFCFYKMRVCRGYIFIPTYLLPGLLLPRDGPKDI